MSWIITYTGRRFDVLDPRPQDVSIEDIAHALSLLCRFAGHTRRFYSVAQHCVLVSEIVPEKCALAGLLHDAAEAYIGDTISPLKAALPDIKPIEARIRAAVHARFGLVWPLDVEANSLIKYADLAALATERRELIKAHPDPWPCLEGIQPLNVYARAFTPWNAEHAEWVFQKRFAALWSQANTMPRKLAISPSGSQGTAEDAVAVAG